MPKFTWRTFSEPGINGEDFDKTHEDIKNVQRLDKVWPEDEFGAKLSLGPNYGNLLQERMGPGDITMRTDGEAVDPPRYNSNPMPGTRAFGERAEARRRRLRRQREESVRPDDPQEAQLTDVVSGRKIGLKRRRKQMEELGDF